MYLELSLPQQTSFLMSMTITRWRCGGQVVCPPPPPPISRLGWPLALGIGCDMVIVDVGQWVLSPIPIHNHRSCPDGDGLLNPSNYPVRLLNQSVNTHVRVSHSNDYFCVLC